MRPAVGQEPAGGNGRSAQPKSGEAESGEGAGRLGYLASIDERETRLDIYHVWCNLKPGVGDTEFSTHPGANPKAFGRRKRRGVHRFVG